MSVIGGIMFDAAFWRGRREEMMKTCPKHPFWMSEDQPGARRCTHEGCSFTWTSPELRLVRAEALAVIAGKSDRYQSLVPMTPDQANEAAMIAAATAWQKGCNDIWERLQAAVLNDTKNTRVLSIPSRPGKPIVVKDNGDGTCSVEIKEPANMFVSVPRTVYWMGKAGMIEWSRVGDPLSFEPEPDIMAATRDIARGS